MNITFWLPFCLSLMIVSLFFSKVSSRVAFLIGISVWSLFLSGRGSFGPDTFVYVDPIASDSGLGLWIVWLSDFAQLLTVNLVTLHASLYFTVALLTTLLPDKLYKSLATGWCFYLALGGFVSDTSTIRWSFCYLAVVTAFFVLVRMHSSNTAVLLSSLCLVVISLGLLGYPGSVLWLLPQLLYEVISWVVAARLTIQPKIKQSHLLLIAASPAIIFVVIYLATSIIQRYAADIVFFNDFVGLDLSLPKVSLALFSSFFIVLYSQKLMILATEQRPSGGPTVYILLLSIFFFLFLSSIAIRLAPICVSALLVFGNLKYSSIAILGRSGSFVLPNIYKYLLLILIPASYIYSLSYVNQSSGFAHDIGLYHFP